MSKGLKKVTTEKSFTNNLFADNLKAGDKKHEKYRILNLK